MSAAEELCALGFQRYWVNQALELTNNNKDYALEWLLSDEFKLLRKQFNEAKENKKANNPKISGNNKQIIQDHEISIKQAIWSCAICGYHNTKTKTCRMCGYVTENNSNNNNNDVDDSPLDDKNVDANIHKKEEPAKEVKPSGFELRVGSTVDVYSAKSQAWIEGKVREIKGDLICVVYKKHMKWLKTNSRQLRVKVDQQQQEEAVSMQQEVKLEQEFQSLSIASFEPAVKNNEVDKGNNMRFDEEKCGMVKIEEHPIGISQEITEEFLLKNQIEDDIQKMQDDEICKLKFKRWLFNTVKLKQYLSKFEENECNDVRMIEFLDEDTIKNDIGIDHKLHCKLILKKVSQYKQLQIEFNEIMDCNKQLKQYNQIFEEKGILTLKDLQNDFETKLKLGRMLKIKDENKLKSIWDIIHPEEDQDISEGNDKGNDTAYI